MTRALVTGGCGFVGANLVRRLLEAGYEVHLIEKPGSSEWRIAELRPRLRIHHADLADAAQVTAVMRAARPQQVFHLAAHGAYSFQNDAVEMARTNYLGTVVLAQACLQAGVAVMINAGSSSEYGLKDHPPAEDEIPEPNSDYAATKAAATQYCTFAGRRHGLPMPTLRFYSLYGPWEDPRRLLPALVVHALDGRFPPLVSPETARDFVHVDDACEAVIALAANPPSDPGAVFNLGSGVQLSMRELVAVAGDLFGVTEAPVWGSHPQRKWDTNVWVSNPAKLQAHLGWRARTGLPAGMTAMADWLRADPARLASYRSGMTARTTRAPA